MKRFVFALVLALGLASLPSPSASHQSPVLTAIRAVQSAIVTPLHAESMVEILDGTLSAQTYRVYATGSGLVYTGHLTRSVLTSIANSYGWNSTIYDIYEVGDGDPLNFSGTIDH